jgi:trk system potassium uptake protein TrkA
MAQVAVIGLGRFGFHVAKQLHKAGHDVLAIDIDPKNVEEIADFSSRAVVLDARDKERLDALGIRDFDVVVVSLGERIDASALVALHLKEIGVRRLITKAGSEDHGKLLELIGVNQVVFPEREAAERLARHLGSPNLLDYIHLGDEYSLHEMAPPSSFLGKSLEELQLPARFDVRVLAIRDALTQKVQVNPGADCRIKDSDALLLLGRNEDLARIKQG